ncbi:hypothetical protein MNBD_PLANCTO03-544 [hydrothermal vent metagenome]|uniref:Uncharacterized protein n=1 Tax=hydrothermal vent metagenome TaxID=652676 RepID=A0A3B1DLC6_9ZZZZ
MLVLIGSCTISAAQTESTENEKQEITEVFRELSAGFSGHSLAKIGRAAFEGMEFVEEPYSMRPSRALAMLSLEQDYIAQILEAAELAGYTVAEMPPVDPFQEVSPALDDTSAFRSHARILDRDTMRCWLDGDFDGALERIAGVIRLADMLIETSDPIATIVGGALREMAKDRLEAMADAAVTRDPAPQFSLTAIDAARDQILSQPRYDPHDHIRLTTTAMRRHMLWMRETFESEDGAKYYTHYLAHYGQTEQALLKRNAQIQVIPEDLEFLKAYISDDPEVSRKALDDHWESLTAEAQTDAYRKHLEMIKKVEWWPTDFIPRLYPGDVAQQPTAEQISQHLDRISTMLDQLEHAQTRDEVRASLLRLRITLERDRSQVTRICANVAGSTALMNWKKSIETYDASLAALDRLETFVEDPGGR